MTLQAPSPTKKNVLYIYQKIEDTEERRFQKHMIEKWMLVDLKGTT